MEGIERIKQLAAEIEDEPLLEIINYLISREDMNEKYLNEEKSLKQMVDFIKSEAKKQAKNNIAMVKDEVVFGWAIHYFDESNEDLGLDKKAESWSPASKPKVEEKETETIEQKEVAVKTKKSSKKSYSPEGQLTLF